MMRSSSKTFSYPSSSSQQAPPNLTASSNNFTQQKKGNRPLSNRERRQNFEQYVQDNHIIEEFAEAFVVLFEKKKPTNAQEIVKQNFGQSGKNYTKLQEVCATIRKENSQLRAQIIELRKRIDQVRYRRPLKY